MTDPLRPGPESPSAPASEEPRPVRDRFGRPLGSLRVSVTDRCNLRCQYCMPEEEYVWLPRKDLLSFEETAFLVERFTALGVTRLRITGGEPLIRRHLPDLIRLLAAIRGLRDIALTTNGLLLAGQAEALREAGLGRITVSLDTLREDRFRALTRRDGLAAVRDGIAAARAAGLLPLKLDTVAIRGVNDDELVDLFEFASDHDAEIRFIEYMDVGGATGWRPDLVLGAAAIREAMARRYGGVEPVPAQDPAAPARRYRIPDGRVFGVIASVSEPFCSTCDRSRVTADGRWFRCLYAAEGLDLRGPLRAGMGAGELEALLAAVWSGRADRGAEERAALADRAPLLAATDLRKDPHLEMHTRGG